MRDHEMELIAALVEGRLDDEAEARALIASSPEHAEEYEVQKLAYETLQSLDTVSMSETERAALHRDVWTTLTARPAAKAANPWWYRWTAVAAALLVIGGSVAVLNQNMGGEDDAAQTFAEIGASLDSGGGESTGTTAAAAEAPAVAGDDADGGGDGAGVTTTMAAEVSEGLSSDQPAALYSARASDVRQGDETVTDLYLYGADEAVDPAIEVCVATATGNAGLDGFAVIATMDEPDPAPDSSTTTETDTDDQPDLAVASPQTDNPAGAPLAFVDLDTCEVVYLDE